MIRALAVDIDGTLTDDKRVLCPAAVQAICKLRTPAILVTGNTHCFTRTVSVLLGTPRIFISENGGVVSHSEKDMEILADLKVCQQAFEELSKKFPCRPTTRPVTGSRTSPCSEISTWLRRAMARGSRRLWGIWPRRGCSEAVLNGLLISLIFLTLFR